MEKKQGNMAVFLLVLIIIIVLILTFVPISLGGGATGKAVLTSEPVATEELKPLNAEMTAELEETNNNLMRDKEGIVALLETFDDSASVGEKTKASKEFVYRAGEALARAEGYQSVLDEKEVWFERSTDFDKYNEVKSAIGAHIMYIKNSVSDMINNYYLYSQELSNNEKLTPSEQQDILDTIKLLEELI